MQYDTLGILAHSNMLGNILSRMGYWVDLQSLESSCYPETIPFLLAWIICIVAIVLIMHFIPPHFWTFITFVTPWLQIVGAACLVIFTAFTLWARWCLGIMWSSLPVIKVDHQLRTEGPYRITRHPIYTGI